MGKKSGGKKKHSNNTTQASPDKKYGPILIVGFVVIAAFVLIATSGKSQTGSAAATGAGGASATAVQPVDVTPAVVAGGITVDEAAVRKVGNAYYEYQQGGRTVPLMAYVGPKSGKIITAVSLCEPCKGQKFRIEGDKLICNTCGTIFEVETHKGISGSCVDYEPELLPSTIENGKIVIQDAEIANWKPRV